MTPIELRLLKNDTKLVLSFVRCPACNMKLNENKIEAHITFVHNKNPDLLSWKLATPEIEEHSENYSVIFPLRWEDGRDTVPTKLKYLIEQYYTQLYQRYNAGERNGNDSTIINIVWDNLIFEKDRIRFQHKDHYILPLHCDGIVPQLNDLKESYFNKEHKILLKFLITNGQVIKEFSSGWQKLLEIIDLAKVQLDFNLQKIANKAYRIPDISGMSNSEIIEKHAGESSKSYYIQLLAGLQTENFQIIPIIENRIKVQEVSFVFSLMAQNRILLIWENCSENRGTHIFTTNTTQYHKNLQQLKSYIRDPHIFNKRRTLWQYDKKSLQVKNMLNHFLSLRHSERQSFLKEVQAMLQL